MSIIYKNFEVPILTDIIDLDPEYQKDCINAAIEIGDEMKRSTNLYATMSTYQLHRSIEGKIYNKLIIKLLTYIENNYDFSFLHEREKNLIDKQWLELKDFWTAIYKKGDFCIAHSHTPMHVSFVYYLKCDEFSSPIEFSHLNYSIKPKNNLLLVFPSLAMHSVPVQKEGGDRILVAGNLNVRIPEDTEDNLKKWYV